MSCRITTRIPFAVLVAVAILSGCATAPAIRAPAVTPEEKIAWILRLEDQRILRAEAAEASPVEPAARRADSVAAGPVPDLVSLIADPEPRVRRRAARAIGRVGLAEGVGPLTTALADPEPEVRAMAAFGLGLLGDRRGVPALTAALVDAEPLVRGRAAEALGLIGDAGAAPAIGDLVASGVRQGVAAGLAPDDEGRDATPEIDAFRLGLYALARLKSYEPLATAILHEGQPLVRWWPVAYALQRIEDPRALPALLTFARLDGRFATGFAARGLGAIGDPAAVDVLIALAEREPPDPHLAAAAVRALGQIQDERSSRALRRLLQRPDLDPSLRLEVVGALGALRDTAALDYLLDLMADRWPALRAAAAGAVAAADPDGFLLVLSGLDPDTTWSVRAALAEALAEIDPAVAAPRLEAMLQDGDLRVLPAVLASLVKVGAPGVEEILLAHLRNHDPVVRMAAARELGALRPAGADSALVEAYRFGRGDPTYVARAAALEALARYGLSAAEASLQEALADRDWAVRVRAAALLRDLGVEDAEPVRPAPASLAPAGYEAALLVTPPVSPHVFVETSRGTIQIELAVLDAPLTAQHFIALARRGFFNGLSFHRVVPNFVVQGGDPRGDGEGGPGFTIRDELSPRPYLRGTVGMALDWRDTGGSQFFITHSPQPHLDARYTVFGTVVDGMEVVDRIRRWDVITAVRVWDGVQMTER